MLAATLRGLAFPKQMHWDATLGDGRGELLFGRPIRWLLFLYGGRVVPFTIGRTSAAQSSQVQDVSSGAFTYGHRFLTTSGRAGRAIKVRSFDEYRSKLLENFVILGRSERHDKIVRELDAKALRLKGRVSRSLQGESGLLDEVPDLVEYPSVVAGTFGSEFTQALPEEVLTTTLIHHQHYFPVEGDDGRLKPAFLAVINTEPENERAIASNAERVVTARLRDAKFFWDADRRIPLESRVERLGTLLFHKKLGTYRDKSERISRLAEWIAGDVFGMSSEAAALAARAAKLAKADLTTDMVREFTELQGVMGGIYERAEGSAEEIWKAIYYHYLPIGVEVDAAPTKTQLGKAAVTWSAVSLADKLDTIVGLLGSGEKPTGSRDPYGLRRAANGVFKILVDLPSLAGVRAPYVQPLIDEARKGFTSLVWDNDKVVRLQLLMAERFEFVLESRGFDVRNVRAITRDRSFEDIRPSDELKKLSEFPELTDSQQFLQLAIAYKRVKNILKQVPDALADTVRLKEMTNAPLELSEPAEKALLEEINKRRGVIEQSIEIGDRYREAFTEAARFKPAVDQFFDDNLRVLDSPPGIRENRVRLLYRLERLISKLANIAEIVPEGS
jgi:glycyl-tRNA synthetase beta chain